MARENFAIKLHEELKKGEVTPVYVNMTNMKFLRPSGTGTLISLGDGAELTVVESIKGIEQKGGTYGIFKTIE